MKEKIKKIQMIRAIYCFLVKHYKIILCKISPILASKYLYKKTFNTELDLNNPSNFNEKLMYLKLFNYNNNKLVFNCSDKIMVRDYALSRGVDEKNLPEIISIYSSIDDIDFSILPRKFVLKCSHGCGFNIVCNDKSSLDFGEAKRMLKKWIKTKYGYETAEPHYTHVKPSLYCEKFIENENGGFPNDYKIYCFNGKPKVILVCSERDKKLRLNFFDLKWNELKIGTNNFRSSKNITKPHSFEEMIDISKKISAEFPFVRCDFYEYNNKAILGEMTFTPAGCVALYYTDDGNKYLGDLIEL